MKKSKANLENQAGRFSIAKEMANYFESQNITAGALSEWTADAIANLSEDCRERRDNASHLLYIIGGNFLPGFINCKTKADRLKFFSIGLVEIFNIGPYLEIKADIAYIGIGYLQNFAKLSNHPDRIPAFMRIYSVFLYLMEIYADYVAYAQD